VTGDICHLLSDRSTLGDGRGRAADASTSDNDADDIRDVTDRL